MAYSKKYLLTKIVEIQEIVLTEKKRGVTQKWVYENRIKNHYHISYPTFNNYLAINAKYELEKLNRAEAERKRQLAIVF